MQSRTDLAPTHSAGALTCTSVAVEAASARSVAASSIWMRTAPASSSHCARRCARPGPARHRRRPRDRAPHQHDRIGKNSICVGDAVALRGSSVNGARVRTSASAFFAGRSPAMLTNSRPGRVLGPIAGRTKRDRHSHAVEQRLAGVGAGGDEFAAESRRRSLQPARRAVRARCTRAKPQFQFGSHCAVTRRERGQDTRHQRRRDQRSRSA